MDFYKNNAYPDVNLHDCNFFIKVIDNNIQFIFPEGVGVIENTNIDWTYKGMIQLSNCSIDELSISSTKPFNFLGIHRMITKDITLKDLSKIFENNGFLQVYNEYYSYQEFVWKCDIYPYNKNKKLIKKYGQIEISAFTESPLEYYLEKWTSILR